MQSEIVKPIIKWVGGKTQILDKLEDYFSKIFETHKDKELGTYYEIFLGGGSVLLAFLTWFKGLNAIASTKLSIKAYDINECLIYMWINIRDNPQEVYDNILPMIEYYNNVSEEDQESYYYIIRDSFNKNKESRMCPGYAAMFIFLNKTGFRGLYREGPNGYNVPFGHYKNPEILNYEHLMKVSNLIQNVEFEVASYEVSLSEIIDKHTKTLSSADPKGLSSADPKGLSSSEFNFAYLDPPYAPENKNSFTKYTSNDFTLDNHKSLFDLCDKLPIPFIMSNSDVDLVKEHFGKVEYKDIYMLESIECKRKINSKNPGSKTMELLIQKK